MTDFSPAAEERTNVIANPSRGPAPDHVAPTRLALTLHIGTNKTGTSSIQSFLHRNRQRLADNGWLYPRSLGRTRHARFGMWIRPDDELESAFRDRRPGTRVFSDITELRNEVPTRLLEECSRSGAGRVLISDEALFGASEPALERLRGFTVENADEVRVVCYLRRQDELLVSHYQQVVKVSETQRLRDRVATKDLSKTYDYYARLRAWLRIVEPDELIVRRFERARFRNGSLYDDFVDAAGLGIGTDDRPRQDRNVSLDADSVEFLRLLNLYRRERGPAPDLPENRQLLPQLARLSTGPTLTLPDEVLDRFMEQWVHSNDRVAREFLGEPDGILFGSRHTPEYSTTEQRLDPGRLDRLLEALDALPTRIAAPLREIAEREAARWPA